MIKCPGIVIKEPAFDSNLKDSNRQTCDLFLHQNLYTGYTRPGPGENARTVASQRIWLLVFHIPNSLPTPSCKDIIKYPLPSPSTNAESTSKMTYPTPLQTPSYKDIIMYPLPSHHQMWSRFGDISMSYRYIDIFKFRMRYDILFYISIYF